MREAQELLDKQDGVTPVHNRFYELSSSYYRLMSNHADYYRDALRYLGCTELSDIPGVYRGEGAGVYRGVRVCTSFPQLHASCICSFRTSDARL